MKRYAYEFPHPAVAVDIAVFTLRAGKLCVLLIQRGEEPFKGRWALPGGFVEEDETVEAAAVRELKEETAVTDADPVQFGIYSDPARDPRERVISIAYLACVRFDEVSTTAGSDAARVEWTSLDDLRPGTLAFDHERILRDAHEALKIRSRETPLVGRMLREPFTLADLQTATEAVIGAPIDKRDFRRRLQDRDWLEQVEGEAGESHCPAQLFRLKRLA